MAIKFYSNLSNAKRALKSKGLDESRLVEVDGSWGIHMPEDEEPCEAPVAAVETVKTVDQKIAEASVISGPGIPKENKVKIEKTREERNGVKRPSVGGKCRAVWDAMDTMVANGVSPTAEAVRVLATNMGWNLNNTVIEFYQWRKFNGINGRSK